MGEGSRVELRTLPAAAGDAGRATPQALSATPPQVTCMAPDGNHQATWAKLGASLQLRNPAHLPWCPGSGPRCSHWSSCGGLGFVSAHTRG